MAGKIIKKCLAVLLLVVIALLSVSSVEKEDEQIVMVGVEVDRVSMTFEEEIACSTHIVSAVFTGEVMYSPSGFYTALFFRPVEVIKGRLEEDTIAVYIVNEGFYELPAVRGTVIKENLSHGYRADQEYLLILEKHSLVFYDFDRYVPIGGNALIPKILTKRYGDETEIKTEESSAFRYYVEELIPELVKNDTSEKIDHKGVDFIKSDSLNDIVPQSDYIFRVTVLDKKGDYPDANNSGYNCRVDEQIKGSTTETIIDVHAFPDSLQVGEQYLMFLTLVGDEGRSRMFNISSKNGSVYLASDTAVREKVDRILSQEN
ncbi:MAG: hypothetical protein IKX86_01605 [Clostridia bacterium]|nr:hypothetical protein [Clostridia bacterium]